MALGIVKYLMMITLLSQLPSFGSRSVCSGPLQALRLASIQEQEYSLILKAGPSIVMSYDTVLVTTSSTILKLQSQETIKD